ncbi:MAG: amidohydrolase [bacterium]
MLLILFSTGANSAITQQDIDAATAAVKQKTIEWRRDIHEHPELSNQEFRTAKLVEDHLRALGFDEVKTGVAGTGVVGLLKGGKPGDTIAIRADMDALPVTEKTGLPFASKQTTMIDGTEVGIMHACGHDAHTAMVMGVAEVFAGLKDELQGNILFIFQPAEEGVAGVESFGAKLMVEEGVLEGPHAPSAIIGAHVRPGKAGVVYYKAGALAAAADTFKITVTGMQTHGARPWGGIDPVMVASQIVANLQTVVSREVDLIKSPAMVSVGTIRGGVRFNIIPDVVEMTGTIRTYDEGERAKVLQRVREIAEGVAAAHRATATVEIEDYVGVLYNDEKLVEETLPSIIRTVGADQVAEMELGPGSDDFARFSAEIPGFYLSLGSTKPDAKALYPNHSPYFDVDESALDVGVRVFSNIIVDYLNSRGE